MSGLSKTESAVRQRLKRRGFSMHKRRSKIYRDHYGEGFLIVDDRNYVEGFLIVDDRNYVVGGGGGPDGYTMTLEECAEWADEK